MKIPPLLILALMAATCGLGYWLGHRHPGATNGAMAAPGQAIEAKPSAAVVLEPLRRDTIEDIILAYGTALAEPGEMESLSVPYESRVAAILVIEGQRVEAGTPLLGVEPSPNAVLELSQAKNARKLADATLAEVKRKFDLKLAVNQDLDLASQAAADSAAKLASLIDRGQGGRRELVSPSDGIVSLIGVETGSTSPPGGLLITVTPEHKVELRLGVEPEDAIRLKADQMVKLTPVNIAANSPEGKIEGKIRMVAAQVNPTTRLVDIYVSVPDVDLLLNAFYLGEIAQDSHEALVAPRAAVLPTEASRHVFTVKDGIAHAVTVSIGLQTADLVELIDSGGLKVGDPVVTSGSYQLEDGMPVRELKPAKSPTTPPTQP